MSDNVVGVDLVAGGGIAITKALTVGARGNLAQYVVAAAPGRFFYLAASDASDLAGYKTMLTAPSAGAEQQIATVCTGTGDVAIEEFATDPGIPGAIDYPAGTAMRSIYARVSGGSARIHLQVYVRNAAGVETLVRDEFSPAFTNTAVALQQWIVSPPSGGTLLSTDRLVTKLYAQRVSGPTTVTVTTHYEGVSPSQLQTTIPALSGGGALADGSVVPAKLTPGGLGAMLYTGAGPAAAWTDPLRFKIDPNGRLDWGSGAALDTAIYRSGSGGLVMSQYLAVLGPVTADSAGSPVQIGEVGGGLGAGVVFGGFADTKLYRSAAGVLKTDGSLISVGGLSTLLASADTQPTFRALPSGKLEWGVGGTTVPDALANLYRSAASRIKCDGYIESALGFYVTPGASVNSGLTYVPSAVVAGSYMISSTVLGEANQRFRIGPTGLFQWGPGGASAVDTSLARQAAQQLRTDGLLVTYLYVDITNAGLKLNFGSVADTTLYRSAAATLKTDGALNVVGDLILSGAAAHLRAAGTVAAAVGGTNIAKLPIYDAANVLIGYIPIYQT